jgi:hypothetical protein
MTRPMFENRAPYCDSYRFFDFVVAIQSDSRQILDLFAGMYQRFRIDGWHEVQASYHVTAEDGVLAIDDEILVLDDPESLADRAYEHILDSIVAKIRSHILIHASVVSWNGHGIIFPAYSGHGKTTLILELVRRGFKFLSDEIAPFDRQHRRIAPFPRSLRVRPGTLALCGYTNLPSIPTTSWRDKLILDIENIQPDSLGGPCPGGYVIVLANPLNESRGLDEPDRTLHIVPERITASLVQEMRGITGVKDVSRVPDATLPVLRLCIKRGALVTPRLEEICREQGVRILDVIKGGERLPDFQASPRLEPISSAEATMEVIRRFRGGRNSILLQQEHQGSATRLFMELADMVSEMQCYRLSVGRLDEMADLVCDLVSGG